VVSVTDPYGRILGFLDRNIDAIQRKFITEMILCIVGEVSANGDLALQVGGVSDE
jgi:hypothetical protein